MRLLPLVAFVGGITVFVLLPRFKALPVSRVWGQIRQATTHIFSWASSKDQSGNPTASMVAVYLASGKVYFGKMQDMDSPEPVLTDVFFLNAVSPEGEKNAERALDEGSSATAESDGSQTNFELVKLTDQFHGPTDRVVLTRDHILFWEPLRSDSRVVQAIEKYHAQRSNQPAP